MAAPPNYLKTREKLIQNQREYYYEHKYQIQENNQEYYNKRRECLKRRNEEQFRRHFLAKKGLTPSDLTAIAIQRNVLLNFE